MATITTAIVFLAASGCVDGAAGAGDGATGVLGDSAAEPRGRDGGVPSVPDAEPDAGPAAPVECTDAADCSGVSLGSCEVPVCGTDGFCDAAPAPDGSSCSDGDGCTAGETCAGGICAGGVTPDCDDGLACTVSACVPMGPESYTCESDAAGSGACLIDGACVSAGTPSGPCLVCDPTMEPNDWSPVADGAACNADDDGCTVADTCLSGMCAPGAPPRCSDSLSCTTDTCRSTGPDSYRCRSVTDRTSCVINDMCREDGETKASNECRVCEAAASDSSWTDSTARCNDGDACTVDDRCTDRSCVGTPRVDSRENNDSPSRATRLSTAFADSLSLRGWETGSSIYPAGDEDWFKYSVHIGSSPVAALHPGARLSLAFREGAREVCIAATCGFSTPSRYSCVRGRAASFGGYQGCCDTASFGTAGVTIVPDCTSAFGTVSSSEVVVRVRSSGAGHPYTCSNYRLQYGDE